MSSTTEFAVAESTQTIAGAAGEHGDLNPHFISVVPHGLGRVIQELIRYRQKVPGKYKLHLTPAVSPCSGMLDVVLQPSNINLIFYSERLLIHISISMCREKCVMQAIKA